MKYIGVLVLLIALALTACNKSSGSGRYSGGLTGRWIFTEYYMSIGGPGSWYPADPPNQSVEFRANGNIESNLQMFDDISGYEIEDSSKVKFFTSRQPSGYYRYIYEIDSLAGSLTLSPLEPACIEGCASKFRRSISQSE